MNTTKNFEDAINEIAIAIQKDYFANERFWDNYSGAEQMDNTGWSEDIIWDIKDGKKVDLRRPYALMKWAWNKGAGSGNDGARGIDSRLSMVYYRCKAIIEIAEKNSKAGVILV